LASRTVNVYVPGKMPSNENDSVTPSGSVPVNAPDTSSSNDVGGPPDAVFLYASPSDEPLTSPSSPVGTSRWGRATSSDFRRTPTTGVRRSDDTPVRELRALGTGIRGERHSARPPAAGHRAALARSCKPTGLTRTGPLWVAWRRGRPYWWTSRLLTSPSHRRPGTKPRQPTGMHRTSTGRTVPLPSNRSCYPVGADIGPAWDSLEAVISAPVRVC
jgi:hypothetical protein